MKINKNTKPSGSWAGKQVLTWNTRVLREPYLKEVRGLGKPGPWQQRLLPAAWELG